MCQRSPMITWTFNCFYDDRIVSKSYRINSIQHLWQVRTKICISISNSYVLIETKGLRIVLCDYRLLFLNKLLSHLERYFLFDSVIWTNIETRILLFYGLNSSDGIKILVSKNDWTTDAFRPKTCLGKYVMYNCVYEITYRSIWRYKVFSFKGIQEMVTLSRSVV